MRCQRKYKLVAAESATYMIRYTDNDTYRSAWRYSWVDGPIAGQKVLKIESVPVKATLKIEQLNKDYFALPKVSKYVKTIYLPAIGYFTDRLAGVTPNDTRGYSGGYWSATLRNSSLAYIVYFNSSFAHSTNDNTLTYRNAVRPFQHL